MPGRTTAFNPEGSQEIVPGVYRKTLNSGATFLGVAAHADPSKGPEWLEERRIAMLTEPDIFRRHYLGDMTVISGEPVYSTYNDAWHCPEKYRDSGIPLVPASLYYGGWDCVAGGTQVYDPMAGCNVPIEERVGRQSWVQSLEGPILAEPAWIAGVKPIFRVGLESGRSIRVTAGHRFLTPGGWRRLDALWRSRNPRIAAAPTTLESHDGYSQAPLANMPCGSFSCARDAYDPLHSRKAQDSQADYRTSTRSCDAPLPLGQDSDLSAFQRQDDAREHALHGQRMGVQASKSGYSHPCPSFDHPSNGGSCRGELCAEGAEYRVTPSQHEFVPRSTQSQAQSLLQTCFHRQVGGCDNQTGRVTFLTQFPSSDFIRWERIVSIEFDGIEPYYDIHVPGPNNYLAEGMWHHNCGATLSPAFLLRQVTVAPFQVHDILEVTSSGGESMAVFAPRVAQAIERRIPGLWDQVRHYADATVTVRSGTNGKSAQQEAKRHGFQGPTKLRPLSNAWLPRYAAVTWLLSRRLSVPGGKEVAGYFVDARHCPTLRQGYMGLYKYRVSQQGDQKGPGQVILEPLKNMFSHIHDAGQMSAIAIRKLIEGGGAKLYRPGWEDEDE